MRSTGTHTNCVHKKKQLESLNKLSELHVMTNIARLHSAICRLCSLAAQAGNLQIVQSGCASWQSADSAEHTYTYHVLLIVLQILIFEIGNF